MRHVREILDRSASLGVAAKRNGRCGDVRRRMVDPPSRMLIDPAGNQFLDGVSRPTIRSEQIVHGRVRLNVADEIVVTNF